MTGVETPVLAQQATGLATVHVGQIDVQQDQVGADLAPHPHPVRGGRRLLGPKLLVQIQLLGQGLAQVVVVVDDQNGLGRRHRTDNGEAWPPRQGLGVRIFTSGYELEGVSGRFRSPNKAVPTLTCVAPHRIAVS